MVMVPSSPAGGTGQPLQPLSHNAQRESELFSPSRHSNFAESASPSRDSSVHEKINQFNTLALQSKTLERKTADAALKRAMLGREEAEAEMRRYRDEARSLRKQVEEGKDRERRVGERLEAVMENYGRAKETHAHTQQLWEKEIRRARKETFKAQSALVKLQEELKSCRTAQKAAEDELQTEREKTQALEQQAFNAQYSLVGLQEQLDQAQERAKMFQQELEAMKTLAKNEAEVSRLSEKHDADLDDDEAEAPRKRQRLSPAEDLTDPDVETLLMRWQWEKQRADRALEQVEFLEAECQLKICAAGKSLRRSSSNSLSSSRRKRASLMQMSDAGDSMILSGPLRDSAEPANPTPRRSKTDMLRAEKEPRRSTIFVPAEGIFRTVSQAEADAMAAKSVASSVVSPTESTASLPITPTESDPMYRRTPSVDPPDFAVLAKGRTSLLSLLNAPHRQDPTPVFNIPTTSGPEPEVHDHEMEDVEEEAPPTVRPSRELFISPLPETDPSVAAPLTDPLPSTSEDATSLQPRPHTTASYYPPTTTVTTTTKVPLREEPVDGPTLAQRLLRAQTQQQQQSQSQSQQQPQQQPFRTPSRQQTGTGTGMDGAADDGADRDPDRPSFDATNPALTPTMTREQALAQIRERRGRARSVGRGPSANTTTTGGGATAGGPSGSGSGSSSSQGRTSRGESQHPSHAQTVRRKVSGGDAAHHQQQQQPVIRRKASGADFASAMGGTAASRGRERERDARREVSAPSATTGGTVRGVVPGNTRRVRS